MDWKKNRPQAAYTSACIKTENKKEFLYGRFEIRAKIPQHQDHGQLSGR
jgi:beta-glucanase (GH16 family)